MKKIGNKNYLLGMLVLIGVASYFDRFVFALAMEPIKQDLGLSDSQLGLMSGFAFAVFYATAGIPIARWADRGNRVTISAASVGLLGVAVSLCGLVGNFFQLLLVRAGVAVGEAGSVPAAQSLIADYFDRKERPKAMAIYFSNFTISMLVGYLLGGWMIEQLGWRITFLIIGIPAVLVALLAKLTIHEPRSEAAINPDAAAPAMLETFQHLWQQRSFRYILISFCFSYFFSMGVNQWLATFLIRTHEMTSTEVGAWLALTWGVFGTAGNYLGGYVITRFASGQEKKQFVLLAGVMVALSIVSALIYLSPTKHFAIACIGFFALFSTFGNGPVFAAIQAVVPERMRSVSVALIFFAANLVGFGLGPLTLGILSDILNPVYGQDSLRYALLIFSPGLLLVGYFQWKVSRVIEADIKFIDSQPHQSSDNKFLRSVDK